MAWLPFGNQYKPDAHFVNRMLIEKSVSKTLRM